MSDTNTSTSKREAAKKVKDERKVQFAAKKALEDEKRLQEAKDRFETQRKEDESREKSQFEAKALRDSLAADLAARKEDERKQILEGIRQRDEMLAEAKKLEEIRKGQESRKLERERLMESRKAIQEAMEKAEAERISKLWLEVYNSRAFKHASAGSKSLISKENPDGLLKRLQDIRFLNSLELASRKRQSA